MKLEVLPKARDKGFPFWSRHPRKVGYLRMAQCLHREQLGGQQLCRDSAQRGRKFLRATQGAAPWTRITELLKCGSSCWPLAPSWSRRLPGSPPLLTADGQSWGPELRGLAQVLRQSFSKSWRVLTKDRFVWYGWVGPRVMNQSFMPPLIISPCGISLRVRSMRSHGNDRCQWVDKMRR